MVDRQSRFIVAHRHVSLQRRSLSVASLCGNWLLVFWTNPRRSAKETLQKGAPSILHVVRCLRSQRMPDYNEVGMSAAPLAWNARMETWRWYPLEKFLRALHIVLVPIRVLPADYYLYLLVRCVLIWQGLLTRGTWQIATMRSAFNLLAGRGASQPHPPQPAPRGRSLHPSELYI